MFRVRYIPIRDGDVIDLGATGPYEASTHYYAARQPHSVIGFKPGPGPKAEGWLVVLIDETAKGRNARKPVRKKRNVWQPVVPPASE